MEIEACITKKRDKVEDYVDDYLKKPAYLRTYSNNFHAILDENLWPNGNFKNVLPPIKKRGVGMPRLSRKRGSNEPKKVQRSVGFRCGICKEVASTSTAPPRPQKATKRMTNKASSSSTPGSTHPGHSSTQTGNATATGAGGSSTTAASPRISRTVTRVLWFPSMLEETLTRRDATNYVSTQPLTQGAPQPSQQSQP
ncbi:hypothetical protein EZV62_024130 [Acer yangbiense]|uniref:Uncharacterized protein n=1 Tax=Acer yangbiense TaxID=1000413 RepID=A0A5C7H5U9_9ROSI|nr:hypothetical protein EZV62_024130 [Acer yangbiense]